MIYSDLFLKKQSRVPSVLIVPMVLLIFGILTFYFFPAQNTQANKKSVRKVEVSNLYPTHATIIWQTNDKDASWIIYGTRVDQLNKVSFDEHGETAGKTRSVHYAELKELTPNTKYYFRMTDGKTFLQSANEGFFSITTAPKDIQINNLKPAYGKLVSKNGAPVPGALITITIPDSYMLTTLTKSNGEWLVPMNYIIDRSTSRSRVVDQNQEVILRASDDSSLQSLVRTKLSLMSPLGENIVLGENYQLNESNQVLSANTKIDSHKLSILFPKLDSVIPANKPLMKGTAPADVDVSVDVINKQNKSVISARVHSNDKGEWKYDVAVPLNPGTYTLKITATDPSSRRSTSATNIFTIAKSGEQVLGDATGSATLTPSPTTGIATATPTRTPTPVLSTTVTPTLVATASATPTITNGATATPVPPVSGITDNTVVISSIAFIILGLGLLVVFK